MMERSAERVTEMKWLKGLFKKESAEDRQRRINASYGGGYQPERVDESVVARGLANPPQGGSGFHRPKKITLVIINIEVNGAE